MQSWKADLVEATASVLCCLAYGVPLLLWIENAPSAWFDIFNTWGPNLRPWLIGAATVAGTLPLIALLLIVKRALRLPR